MRFMPHTDADVRAMLDAIGVDQIEDLIAHVPANLRNTAAHRARARHERAGRRG